MAPKNKPEKYLQLYRQERQTHMGLFQSNADDHLYEVSSTPLFTGPVRKYCLLAGKGKPRQEQILPQFGLLARDASEAPRHRQDPRVFFNVGAPHSVFICGSQGSGKSHTLATLLESCLLRSNASLLSRPLTGLVLHYDRLISDAAGSPCESAYLSSDPSIRVRVLCPPTSIVNLNRIYSDLPNVTVEELRLGQADLNTKRMLDLMAVKPCQNGQMPLYLHVVNRILRDLRLQQQHKGGGFDYQAFKRDIDAERLTESQSIPLQQRLETLESFMAKQNPPVQGTANKKKKKKKKGNEPASYKEQNKTVWTPISGQLTIVDLSCPCITPEMACALFNICLSLFLEQGTSLGKVVALDEAHKYMNDDSQAFTESLLSVIRLQRHLGTRVIISTQEPTISPRLLDLCSITVVHRFSSPEWLAFLRRHIAGVDYLSDVEDTDDELERNSKYIGKEKDETFMNCPSKSLPVLFSKIVQLRTGEAFLFAPTAILEMAQVSHPPPQPAGNGVEDGFNPVYLGRGAIKVQVRGRLTQDGGRSVLSV